MDIDDSSEKIRRNLLIFSFGIVASSFLNLSIQKQSKIFSTIDLASASPFKFWFVITAVLIYLFYRYWFDNTTNHAIDLFKTEFSSNRFALIRDVLNKEIVKSFYQLKAPKYFKQYNVLDNQNILIRNREYGKPIKAESTASPQFNDWSTWSGQLASAYSIEWRGSSYSSAGGESQTFEFSKTKKNLLKFQILLKMIFYSKSVSEFIIPITLFIAALSICVFQLCNNYFHISFTNVCWV